MSTSTEPSSMRCPKCAFIQAEADSCARCGVVIARFLARSREAAEPEPPSLEPDQELIQEHVFTRFLTASRRMVVEQRWRHWWEILTNWEQRNEYDISGDGAGLLGTMAEQGLGFSSLLCRMFLGSHRPLEVLVFSGPEERIILQLERPFYVLNSSLFVRTAAGEVLGQVDSRLALVTKVYDLRDDAGRVFATIRSPWWKPWTFPILDPSGAERAVITKRWGDLNKEYYTDADDFGLDFGTYGWTLPQRAVIVAAMISIDYDYFENNEGRGR